MKPSEDIRPVTYMKTHSAELLETVARARRPMVITQNGAAKVVIQDIESYERDRSTLLLLKIVSQGIQDADRGLLLEQETFFNRLEKKLQSRIKAAPQE